MIPDEVVEEVRARADIVQVIGEFVQLKKSGKDYKGLCPFHDERTPSFYVVPTKGFYKCFGCGVSGDVFSFLMERQGMDFVDAVKFVGGRAGVQVREIRKDEGEEDRFRRLYEANAFARRFYQERLLDPDEGEAARRYLDERGIDEDAIERFGLGYAPDSWRSLKEAGATHDIDEATLLEVGLLKESDKVAEAYDRFRRRIVFPIESVSGKVLGFGGRILPGGDDDGGAPKYLNSPESPIYRKGEILYGLGRARHAIRREEVALIVEGYMDAVSLGAVGIEHVVAPLGTSVTDAQAALLKRYASRAYLLFDSDAAGLRATFRAADILLAHGIRPAVATFPEGEDPDTVVQAEGADGFRSYLEQAVDVLDRKIQILDERDYFSTIEGTREAVDRLLPTLRAAADTTLRDIYVSKVADRTGVRRETLEEELERAAREAAASSSRVAGFGRGGGRRASSGPGRSNRNPRGRSRGRGESDLQRRMGAERTVLWVLLRDPDHTYHEIAAEQIGPSDFVDPQYRALFDAVITETEPGRAVEGLDPPVAAVAEEILADRREMSNIQRLFQESVNRIRMKQVKKKRAELRRLLDAAEEEGDGQRAGQLIEELNRLDREQRRMRPGWESLSPGAFEKIRSNQMDEPSP